ncbi:MAG: hypothetical protein ACI4MS_00450 [Candidatus Coproplasma sp.]
MKHHVKIDHVEKQIIMSSTFAKKQAFTNSPEFREIQALHESFPTYAIITRKIRTNPQKEAFLGLTFEYMETYISSHANAEAHLKEFAELRELAKCHSVRYPNIKKWFLETYPEVRDFKIY